MTQPNDATEALALVQQQLTQAMLEHAIVVQALRTQAIVSALFILVLSCISYFLWKRHADLNAAFLAEIVRNSVERVATVKQHSLERGSELMQMLHAFEGLVSRRRPASASSPVSLASPTTPQQSSTGSSPAPAPTPPPLPPPIPLSPASKRTPR